MSENAKLVAIAERCGFTVTHWKANPFDLLCTKGGVKYNLDQLREELNDIEQQISALMPKRAPNRPIMQTKEMFAPSFEVAEEGQPEAEMEDHRV